MLFKNLHIFPMKNIIVKGGCIIPIKNIKNVVCHLNSTNPLVIDMEIIIKKKTKKNTKLSTLKLTPKYNTPCYDESIIQRMIRNGGL